MILDRHRAKIVAAEQLATELGPRPRARRVVMCHGVFDIVHPGHIRHLLYARQRADVLVASVTGDRHVRKGPHRPHVPQELRAQNLAVLDIVDYVVVSDYEEPAALITLLQPDYYAKGFEYSETARPGCTIQEASVVESYGGEMLFTPGDVVYSSSALIEASPPVLRYDKLRLLMDRADLTFSELRAVLTALRGWPVHVVGDLIVDSLTHCALIGSRGKTPTHSLLYERRDDYVGGAGVVAKHLAAAGADVYMSTVVGADSLAEFAIDDLRDCGVEVDVVVDQARPTVHKNAFVADGYRLLKVDTLDNRSISDGAVGLLRAALATTPARAVVFSDFRHGIFNARTIPSLTSAIPDGVFRAADSQVASRWGNILDFAGFDLLTPNEREARFALGDQDSGVRPLAARLYDVARCRVLLMKMGERGVLGCLGPDHDAADSHFAVDSFAGEVRDPVGAGDALLAYAALAMLVQPDPIVAAILGSFAAGVECEYDGNVPVTPEQVSAKIDESEREI